jgi:hypothetical protein
MTTKMTQNGEYVLAVLPAERRVKNGIRDMELTTLKSPRNAAEQKQALALRKEPAAMAVQGWNTVHDEFGSFADEHSTL